MQSRGVRRILPALAVAACAIFVFAIYSTRHVRAEEPPFFAIKGARIVPVSGPPIANGTIVISKGVIQSVGANVSIPPEARVIDGTGMTIYPGLIDAGTDVGLGAPVVAAGSRRWTRRRRGRSRSRCSGRSEFARAGRSSGDDSLGLCRGHVEDRRRANRNVARRRIHDAVWCFLATDFSRDRAPSWILAKAIVRKIWS